MRFRSSFFSPSCEWCVWLLAVDKKKTPVNTRYVVPHATTRAITSLCTLFGGTSIESNEIRTDSQIVSSNCTTMAASTYAKWLDFVSLSRTKLPFRPALHKYPSIYPVERALWRDCKCDRRSWYRTNCLVFCGKVADARVSSCKLINLLPSSDSVVLNDCFDSSLTMRRWCEFSNANRSWCLDSHCISRSRRSPKPKHGDYYARAT